MKRKSNLRKWYDKITEKYDTWGTRKGEVLIGSRKQEILSFRKMLPCIKGKRVLDIGTGTGIYLIEMAKYGCVCYGIDISKNMLREAKKKIINANLGSRIFLREMDAEKFDFPSNFFDFVSCIGVMEYYNKLENLKILKEIHRVLKRGEKVIIDFPDAMSEEAFFFKERESSVGNTVFIKDLNSIKEFFKKAGFKIIKKRKVKMEIQFIIKK